MDARALIPAGAAVAFVIFLVWKMWPSVRSPLSRRHSIDPRLPELRARARSGDGRVRAAALCEAGGLSLERGHRTAAFGYYLRAARADLGSAAPIRGIARALERKPRSLERVLWRALSVADMRTGAARAGLEELSELYRRTREPTRADALRRMIALLPADAPGASIADPSGTAAPESPGHQPL